MKFFGVLFFLLVAFIAPCTGTCNASCLAYQWALPLWKMANSRFLQGGSITFAMNKLAFKRSNALNSNTLSLCTQSLCSGTPGLLNPAPIVSPNVDTLYGDAWLDLQSNRCWKLSIPNAATNTTTGTLRWYGISIVDMYTNTLLVIDATTNPLGGVFCICPSGTAANCGNGITASFTNLPQYGQLLVRTWSNGNKDSCGMDGCKFLLSLTFTLSGTAYTYLNPRTGFSSYMTNSSQCPYYYSSSGWVPCGPSGSKTNFWQAVCLALSQNPLKQSYQTAEASYVNATFLSLGINSNACAASPNYTSLNFGLANVADSGFTNIKNSFTTSYFSKGPWQFLNYSTNGASSGNAFWGTDYFGRGVTATRLQLMNPNEKSVYYTAFADDAGNILNGASSHTWSVDFSGTFPLGTGGFWSLTVYDQSNFMYANSMNRWAVKGATTAQPTSIHLSNTCTSSNVMCLPVPTTPFNIMLRGYNPTSNFILTSPSFTYTLPSITLCGTGTPCN